MKKKGLGARLRALFGGSFGSEESYEDLEDLLIQADLGARTAMEIVDQLRDEGRREKARDHESLVDLLSRQLVQSVPEGRFSLSPDRLDIILVLGVNGVGKTTSIAKLTRHFLDSGQARSVCLAAGDTFRAAAVEQLTIHAERLGVRIVKQGTGADSAAVIYDAIESARQRGDDLVIADTAGRMHTKKNLIEELSKIDRIVSSRAPDAAYHRFLVIDATTGQNGFHQAETFQEAVPVDGVILAKYDSTAKGGILVPIGARLGIPALYVGTGEAYSDIAPFDREAYVRDLLDTA